MAVRYSYGYRTTVRLSKNQATKMMNMAMHCGVGAILPQ
jgi:hypothetical protein